MVSKATTIINPEGFHMRAAGIFVKEMTRFKSDVTVSAGEKSVNGKSIMRLMSAGFKRGTEVTIRCEGEDEASQLETACALIDAGLGDKT